MEWYYAIDGQRHGPVSEEAFAHLVAAQTVRADTLVWRAGMAQWQTWAEVAPTVQLPAVPPQLPLAGESIAPAASDPMAEMDAETLWQRLRAHGYQTSIGSVLDRAWTLYKSAFWPCLGVTLLAYLIIGVSSNIPLLGLLANFLVVPQITAGLYWYFVNRARGEYTDINDLFSGFSRAFGQLALVALIQVAILLPFIIAMGVSFAALGLTADNTNPELGPQGALVVGIVLLVALILGLLMYRLILAHIIVLDRNETAWNAIKLSWRIVGLRFWTLLGLAIALMLLGLAGMLALLIGLIFVLPIMPAAYAYVYEDALESARRGGDLPTTQP